MNRGIFTRSALLVLLFHHVAAMPVHAQDTAGRHRSDRRG